MTDRPFPILILLVVILFLVVLIGILTIIALIKMKRENTPDDRFPKGHFMGLGIGIGIPLGIPFGLILGNIAFGPAIGVAIGVAIGAALESKNAARMRPLTETENRIQRTFVKYTIYILLIGLLVFLGLYFLR